MERRRRFRHKAASLQQQSGAMAQIVRTWWPVFVALLLIQMGNGLASTLVSVTGQAGHLSPLIQGLILSAFFAGSVAGAFSAPWLIARTSHVVAAVAYTWLLVAVIVCFAITPSPWVWIILRLTAGAAITGMFTCIESWLSLSISDNIRARVFSLYMFIQLAGLAAGQMLLSARSLGNEPLFLLSAGLIAAAAFCYQREHARNPAIEDTAHIPILTLIARAPTGVLCIVLSGFAWAGLMASGPALVEMIGLSDVDKSLFLALAVVSGMLFQLPAGWAADHMDRRIVLAALSALAAVFALVPVFDMGRTGLFAFAVLFGASTFPLYAVGVARISEVLGQSERTSASALMIIFFDIGAVIAPLALAQATSLGGAIAYFIVMALPQALFSAGVLLSAFRRVPQSG
jgi:MFS family permease